MPLRTETIDFGEEVQRLEDEIDELENIINSIGDDVDGETAHALLERLQSLQTHLKGVKWARDEAFEADYAPMWDDDVDAITLAGLTGGEFGRMQDDLEGAGSGAARVHQVEAGTEDAPYIDDSMDRDQRIATVSDLPVHYLMWAESRIDDLTGLGGNARINYDDLRAEMQTQET
ncbi:hypothetical protein RBH26_20575 [Natronolimnohabitans sp. A-GB9]|uniref:hypothetical protein n=1 Tax=Natronolimnohabitans sp. A-GB9 TaxID=3069757 RepID=UPI0027B22492|nr:hypothetical protein [Natronolimnohabitans sp. A-GB9]MDQ2052840.1 hypothetical protein [Natronolimnohabitans sp. A-GB9]